MSLPQALRSLRFRSFTNPADQWQVQLLWRILGLGLGMAAFLLLRDLATGQDPRFSAGAVALVLAGMVTMTRHPAQGRRVAALLFICTAALILASAATDRNSAAPVLCLSLLPGTLATLLEGAAFGSLVNGLVLAGLLALALAYPPASQRDAYRLVNEGIMVGFGFLVAWAMDHTFRRLQRGVQDHKRSLESNAALGQTMATALFSDLAPLLTSLRTGLEDPSRDPLTVRPTVQALAARLTAARTLYVAEGVRARPLAATEADVRRFLSRSSILITAGVLVTTLTRNLIWGGPQASSAWVLLIFPLLWWSLGRWPDRFTPARVNGVLLLAAYIAAGRAFLSWGHSATSPNLPLMPALMFMAGMLNGPAVVAGTFLGCGGMLAWAGLSGPVTPDQLRLLTNLSLLLVLMALIAFSVVQLRQAFLGQLRQQAEAVREALQLRRRLAGTLFHDVSNQLAALTGTLELAVIEQAEPAATRSAARRFCARIDGLVGVSRDFLMGDGQLDPGQLRPMAVPTLFRDIEDLFQGRLKAKRQTLMMLGEGGLRVLGLPEIITESVLGNLMSNAIKFSPLGAIIELEAQREGDGVALLVRDAGPGIPQALIDALAADGPLPSSPGSAGEAGQGYGLKLVREHLQRLGGRLDLRRHPDGGTVAVAWLKAA